MRDCRSHCRELLDVLWMYGQEVANLNLNLNIPGRG